MSMENPMLNTEDVKKGAATQPETALDTLEGEARKKPQPELTVVSKQAEPYVAIIDQAAAEAERLFKENQKRAKALGLTSKKWDKNSALYIQWYNATQLVKAAEKAKNFYNDHGDIDAEYAKYDARIMDKKLSAAERMEASKRALEFKKLIKQAEELKNEISDRQEAAKPLETEISDEKENQAALEARWKDIELPKKKSVAEQVAEIRKDINAESAIKPEEKKTEAVLVDKDAETLARQKEQAALAADQIAAEQRKQIEDQKMAHLMKPGVAGWFRRLFANKEDKAKIKQAEEAAMLKKWGEEADAELNKKWTPEDEREEERQALKPGRLQRYQDERGYNRPEQARINRKARKIDKAADKRMEKERKEKEYVDNWETEIDESVAKQGRVDKLISRLSGNPEQKAVRMRKKLEKAADEEEKLEKDIENWKV